MTERSETRTPFASPADVAWDTIVVGSGPGGLTAATALARAGQRVLVLEQHYLPGGWSHSFNLGGYRFSPGIHYVGELGKGGAVRAMFEGLGVASSMEWREMNPDGFDHFVIGGERLDQPKGLDRWIARLKERFPHQRANLDRYFGITKALVDDVKRSGELLRFPHVLALPFRAPTLCWWALRSFGALLDATITDARLKAVLSAQAGNHGLPPSRASLAAHAMMSAHYWDGAWYPRGGARSIPRAYLEQLRAHRGQIRVRSRVQKILVEGGRATGVELEGGERLRSGQVVCNADPAVVYGSLLDPALCRRERRKVDHSEYSHSLLSAFCAVDLDLERLGYDSGNYWWYRDTDVEGAYARVPTQRPDDPIDALFLTITTLKDPGHAPHGHHTVELFTFVPWAMFDGLTRGGADYLALKKKLGAKMLVAAENLMPGLSRHLKFFEVGTPLTNVHYCNVFQGASYGTAKTPFQVGPFAFSQVGPVPGLHLCGASTLSHGFAGAAFSGLVAAQQVLGLSDAVAVLQPPRELHALPAGV